MIEASSQLHDTKIAGDRAAYPAAAVLLTLLFLVTLALKLVWASRAEGAFLFSDELVYKGNAESIYQMAPYENPKAPPLYSILISPAFAISDWYRGLLYLSAFYSSLTILAVWLAAKPLLPPIGRLAAAVLAALLPLHVLYSRMVMSENLYYPILLVAVYLVLRAKTRFPALEAAALGFVMGLLCLTRFISIVILPALALCWWIKPLFLGQGLSSLKSVRWGLMVLPALGGFLLALLPWILYAHFSDMSIAAAFGGPTERIKALEGFGGADRRSAQQMIMWLALYLSYLVLMLSPYLLFLLMYLGMILWRVIRPSGIEYLNLLLVAGLTASYLFVSTYHSWGAYYNYPKPVYMVGRYLNPLTPVYCILAVIALSHLRFLRGLKGASILVGSGIITLSLVWISRGLLYKSLVWELPRWLADIEFFSPDSSMFSDAGFMRLYVLVSILAMLAILLYTLMPRTSKVSTTLAFGAACLVLAVGSYQQASRIAARQFSQGGVCAAVARYLLEHHPGDGRIGSLVVSPKVLPTNIVSEALVFWNVKRGRVTVDAKRTANTNSGRDEREYFLATRAEMAGGLAPIADINDRVALYEIKDDAEVTIKRWGPKSTIAGRGFNTQASGESYLWMIADYVNPEIMVSVNGRHFRPNKGERGLLSLKMPRDLYARPGTVEIKLIDPDSGKESEAVLFTVEDDAGQSDGTN